MLARLRTALGRTVVCTVFLAGCTSTVAPPATAPTPAAPAPASQAKIAGTISLGTWQHQEVPGIGEWWKSVDAAYEREYGGKITLHYVPTTDYLKQLLVELANNSAPDVIMVSSTYVGELAPAGALRPLDDLAGSVRDRMNGGWDNLTSEGKPYAVPIAGRTFDLIYNDCMFKEAGVAKVPTTPTEFLETARSLTRRDASGKVTQYGVSMRTANEDPTYEMLLMWTIAFGGRFTDASGKWVMTSQPVVDALNLMKTLYDEELTPRGVVEADLRALFASGKTAMQIDGPFQFPFIQKANPDPAKYACFKSAKHPWSGPATGGINTALAINAKTRDVASAWAYIDLATRPELQKTFSDFSPIIPVSKSAMTPEQVSARPYITPWLETIGGAELITPKGHEKQYSQAWPIVVNAVLDALVNKVPTAQALGTAQTKLEALGS